MPRRVPKILVHDDGTAFAVWNPEGKPVAYAMYFTDEDAPPKPSDLNIDSPSQLFAEQKGNLRWVPVTVRSECVEVETLIEPYEVEE